MAKKDVKNTKKVVDKPAEGFGVSTRTTTADQSQATQVPEKDEEKVSQEELSNLPEQQQNSGKQTDGAEDTEVDSASKTKSAKAKGVAAGSEVDKKRNRIAEAVFEKNTNCKVLYFTADLVPFFEKTDALRHGVNSLKDDTIVIVKRK